MNGAMAGSLSNLLASGASLCIASSQLPRHVEGAPASAPLCQTRPLRALLCMASSQLPRHVGGAPASAPLCQTRPIRGDLQGAHSKLVNGWPDKPRIACGGRTTMQEDGAAADLRFKPPRQRVRVSEHLLTWQGSWNTACSDRAPRAKARAGADSGFVRPPQQVRVSDSALIWPRDVHQQCQSVRVSAAASGPSSRAGSRGPRHTPAGTERGLGGAVAQEPEGRLPAARRGGGTELPDGALPWHAEHPSVTGDARERSCETVGVADRDWNRSATNGSEGDWASANGSAGMDGGWHPASAIWTASCEELMERDGASSPLTPPWGLLLLSDGSVTRHLQLVTRRRVGVRVLEMRAGGGGRGAGPGGVEEVAGPRVLRQVHLVDPDGTALVYAASWWPQAEVDSYLHTREAPIWANLSAQRTELFRDVRQLYRLDSAELERIFGVPGPFWARHYLFYHDGRPITLIYEVFSRSLEKFLGPS